MAELKQGIQMQAVPEPNGSMSPSSEEVSSLKKGTTADQQDMQRLGKTQETKVSLLKALPA